METRFRKLAVVVDTFPRWSERFIARELAELQRCGVDFSVFCLKAGTLPSESDTDWDGLIERRVVLPSCIASLGGLEVLAASQKCASKLAGLLKDQKFQHLHAHFASLPTTIGLNAATLTGLPFSMSVHARDLFVDAEDLDEKIAEAERIFTCHGRATEFLAARGAKNVVCMHHGLPLERFPYLKHVEIARQPLFIAVGRFVPKKGLAHAIEALADPRLANADARLALIGEGPEEKRLKRLAAKLKVDARVQFLPPQSSTELHATFKSAAALIAPYETAPDGDADGIPNVILEAFALGLPVIGTGAGGLSEVLTPETGTVVPEKNAPALANALAEFIATGAASGRAFAARKRVERDFDIRQNIAPLLELLKSS
jgi:colanic acid/amylovoran biosynthesis glycosyltransferase